MLRYLLIFTFSCIIYFPSQAQLELDKIMAGPAFVGYQPEDIVWSPGNTNIYFRWKHENELVAPYYEYSLSTKKYRKLSAEETHLLPVDGYISDRLKNWILFQKDNTLYEWTSAGVKDRYTRFTGFYVHAVLDKNRLLLREGDNLFLYDRLSFTMKQITNFHQGNKPNDRKETNFLTQQQEELFEIVRTEKKRSTARKEFNEQHSTKTLSPFYLEGRYLSFVTVNPQLTHAVFGLDKYPEDVSTHFEEYVNASGYSRSVNARPKVGSEDPTHEIYVWDFAKDTCFQLKSDQLTDIKKKPIYLEEYVNPETTTFEPYYDTPKKVIFLDHGFNDKGDRWLVEIKSYDNKDRWLAYYDISGSTLTEFNHQHEDTWIGGPGISSWKTEAGNVGWINDRCAYYQSEATGYSHLYKIDFGSTSTDANQTTQLTQGNYEVHQAILSNDRSKFFITANKIHPGNREFYTLEIANQKLTPILTNSGNHEVFVSPDEKWLAVRYSYKNKPWELYLAPLKENTTLTQITQSTTSDFNTYSWRDPEVISFKASDGTDVYARVYEPSAEKKNGAGVIFVHGAGYLQNAHNWWSHYHREYMFHNLLADKGYTVMDIDYRASEGYGENFRTGIYRFMGGKDLDDHLDGRNVLIKQFGIDSTRVGIYGGSYGGFITLMAMLTQPGKFKCGAALRSVTDWAHYNHEYTSNILNTPELDPKAFERSSPIYFAEGLQGRLLMLHGMEDDNVQFQDVVRLSQRFIELKKTNWDLIGYPIEPHGFVETTSWYDEYRRILEMFDEELVK